MMFVYILLSFFLGLGTGYFLLRRHDVAPGAVDLMDPEEQKEFSTAGQKAISERIERRKARILKKASQEGRITNDGVEDMFCIGDSTAGNYLKQLVSEGKLERIGSGRGTHYIPRKEN